MAITIPPLSMVRARLKKLTGAQMEELAKDSGVGKQTLVNIRYGITANPGIETVRRFWPLLVAEASDE